MIQTPNVGSGSQTTATEIIVTAPRPPHRSAFSELVSELNPLQYLPVVGTIYRALTGDRISEEARTVGSFVVSGLTGGPAGVAISAALMGVEKLVGIDPEKLGQTVLAEAGLGERHLHSSQATAKEIPVLERQPIIKPAPAGAWSAQQLSAYGVTSSGRDSLRHGSLHGSDVLNELELARLTTASASAP